MLETSQMLTPRDVAGILGVHPKTVHLWLRTGKLKGVKISYRAWRIPRSALDRFIEENSNEAARKGIPGQEGEGGRKPAPEEVPVQSIENPASPQVRMKHYIRDIMGEKIPPNIPDNKPGNP